MHLNESIFREYDIRGVVNLDFSKDVVENLEDTLFWIEKGVEMDMRMIDVKLAGALTKEAWERNSSLLSGSGKTYTAYKTRNA